jgi:hypothetical protein
MMVSYLPRSTFKAAASSAQASGLALAASKLISAIEKTCKRTFTTAL